MAEKFEGTVLDLIESASRNSRLQPLNLGGIAGAGGGAGGPPGGFIGWLPQTRVAYDQSEDETLFTPASGMSLLDNLNHMRYRLGQLEISSGILVVDEWDGDPSVADVNRLTFSGSVVVTDLGGGHALVTVTASGGGGGVEEAPEDSEIYGRSDAAWIDLDGFYLRLDTDNNPLTGELKIEVPNDKVGTRVTNTLDEGFVGGGVGHLIIRTMGTVGTPIVQTVSLEPAIMILDVHPYVAYSGGTIFHRHNPTGQILVDLNPYVGENGDIDIVDSYNDITTSGTLISRKNQGVEKFSVDGLGTVNIASGQAYNIDGTPHTHLNTDGLDTIRTKYIIAPSISSSNLTVALKYVDGTDPSPTNKLTFRVGNTEYDLTAAASYTKNAGTNWHNAGSVELAAKDIDYFVYAIGETGASAGLKFGHSRISHATTMSDFISTSTNEKTILGSFANFNSSDHVLVIGRFRAQLSASASFNWSIPTAKVINYPIYHADWLTWQPAYAASASMTFTSVTTNLARYQVCYRKLGCELKATGTTGGTASFGINATLPFSSNNAPTFAPPVTSYPRDGILYGGFGYLVDASPDRVEVRKYDSSVFGLGTGREMNVMISCEI